MKTITRFALNLAAAVLIVIASATIAAAAAGEDTCFGFDATIGATCTQVTNTTSLNNGNTAFGFECLFSNMTGTFNTAIGAAALALNTMGSNNTASGEDALESNTTGGSNTATGAIALGNNVSGSDNTATGDNALGLNKTGSENTAIGMNALDTEQAASMNTAIGAQALDITTGNSNIGIGFAAGNSLTTGSNNIDIGNAGVAAEANTIRIGTQGTQTETFIAGIFGTPKIKKACGVVVQSTGQLGCVKSSVRYKRDVRDMGDASDKLMKLRPVIFQYKEDSDGIKQYGLIAEEVEKVYPELVIDGADGKAEAVEYQVLPAMLLNEVQKQARQLVQKDAQIASMQRQIEALRKKDAEIDGLAGRLDALERQARASRPDRLAAALR